MILASPCLCILLAGSAPGADLQVRVDPAQAEAVLDLLAKRAKGVALQPADWARLFGTAGYRRLQRREAAMKRPFTDDELKAFVESSDLLRKAPELAATLTGWKRLDAAEASAAAAAYLPAGSRIRATIYPLIKPKTNSFVFETGTDPAIFLYLDPAVGPAKFRNTLVHELHHIGLSSACSAKVEAQSRTVPAGAAQARKWAGAFGEGLAMLAAAGGADVHPHATSGTEDRARWDRDLARFPEDLRAVEAFLLELVDGRLDEDQGSAKGMDFFGTQGPWYTVGWRMAETVERRFGRARLLACMCDPAEFLETYNRAAADTAALPRWSPRLLKALAGGSGH